MLDIETTDAFNRQVEEFAGSIERWDEIWWNFEIQLAYHPKWGTPIPCTFLRALWVKTNPNLIVYYHVDDDKFLITLTLNHDTPNLALSLLHQKAPARIEQGLSLSSRTVIYLS